MFSTAILDRTIEQKRNEQEVMRLRLLDKVFQAIGSMTGSIPFREAYVFGSVTRPFGYREGSDVDVAFAGLQNADFFKAMVFLSEALGVNVDVVQLEGHRLADKIKREGTKWTA